MPKKIVNWSKYRAFVIAILFAVFGAYICADMINPMTVVRGGSEGVYYLGDGCTVTQTIPLQNTDHIHISLLREGAAQVNDPDARVHVTLEQGDAKSCTDIYVNTLENRWVLVKLDLNLKEFENGDATLILEGVGVTQEYPVSILFTSGVQKVDIGYATYNGEVVEGSYCCLSWGYFSWTIFANFLTAFTVIAVLIALCVKAIVYARKSIQKYYVIAIYLVVLAIRYIMNINNTTFATQLDQWMTTPWLINYKDGFVSKALPGTIYSLFSDYITMGSMNFVFHGIFLTAVIVSALVMKSLIDRVKTDVQRNIINVILLWYSVGPCSLAVYYLQWGRMDVILTICFLMSIYALLNGRKIWLYSVTVFSVIAILSHQMYVFLMYPAIFGIFAYYVFVKKEKKYSVPMLTNFIVPASLAVYVQFIGKIKMPEKEYLQLLATRTDMGVLDTMVNGEYYITAYENIYNFGVLDSKQYGRGFTVLIFVLLLLPLIHQLCRFWIIVIKEKSNTLLKKFVLIFLAVVPLASVAMFLTISDHGRIVTLVMCELTFMMAALIEIDSQDFNKPAMIIAEKLKDSYGQNYATGFAIYLATLGVCRVEAIPEVTSSLLDIYHKLIGIWL